MARETGKRADDEGVEAVEETTPAPLPSEAPEDISSPVPPVEEAAEAPAPAEERVPVPAETYVQVTNLSLAFACYVPFTGGLVRMAPKATVTVPMTDLTDDTRRVEAEGRIIIRNL